MFIKKCMLIRVDLKVGQFFQLFHTYETHGKTFNNLILT